MKVSEDSEGYLGEKSTNKKEDAWSIQPPFSTLALPKI